MYTVINKIKKKKLSPVVVTIRDSISTFKTVIDVMISTIIFNRINYDDRTGKIVFRLKNVVDGRSSFSLTKYETHTMVTGNNY